MKESKGVILFFHGNSGNNKSWAGLNKLYVENKYEIFFLDYRDFGKSTGYIDSEEQLISDGQIAYNYLKEYFEESNIIVSGTSIGSGIATQIAAKNNPKLLILNAPYFSLNGLIKSKLIFIPDFIIKYKLKTFEYIDELKCSVEIFHGSEDNLIPIDNAIRLKDINTNIELTVCEDSGHNNFYSNKTYINRMNEILN